MAEKKIAVIIVPGETFNFFLTKEKERKKRKKGRVRPFRSTTLGDPEERKILRKKTKNVNGNEPAFRSMKWTSASPFFRKSTPDFGIIFVLSLGL